MPRTWTCALCTLVNDELSLACQVCGSARKTDFCPVESDCGSDRIHILGTLAKKQPANVSPPKRLIANQHPNFLPLSPDLEFLKDTPRSSHSKDTFPSLGLSGIERKPVKKKQKLSERERERAQPICSPLMLGQGCSSSDDDEVDFMSKIHMAASRTGSVVDENKVEDLVSVSKKSPPKSKSPRKRKSGDKVFKEAKRVRKREKCEIRKEEKAKKKALQRKKRDEERTKAAKEKRIQKVEKRYKAKNYMLHEIQIVFHPKVLELNGEILPTLADKSSEWCPGPTSKFHKHAIQYRLDNSIHERMITWEKFHFDPSLGQENPFDKTKRSRNFSGPLEPSTDPKEDQKPGSQRSYAVFYIQSAEVLCNSIMNGIFEESLQFTDVILLVTNYTYSGLPRKSCPVQEKLTTIWFGSENRIRHKMVKTDKEAAQFVGRHTRTLAEEQFKVKPTAVTMAVAAKVTGMEKGVRRTLTDSWILYLMQIDQISEDKARKIVDIYPTFSSLWSAYSSSSVEEGEKLLADKLSNRNESVLSRKVYRWLYAPVTGNETI